MTQPDPFVGRTLGGRFEIKKKIGQGGMAAVYGAVDAPTGHPVALKILPRDLLSEPEYVQRFLREAQSIRSIRHPNVIRIFGMGKEDGLPFYAMEYLPYPDLEGYLKKRRTLPLEEVLPLALGMMRGLEVTHAEGLFHRDIKPANVVVAPENRAILVDFGLVKDTNRTQLTATGAVMGTPLYMSPELIQGEIAEAPSDIYQVGLLVFEMISGKRAHAGDTMVEVAHKVMSGDFDPIERFVPDLSPDWIHLVRNMLGNEREYRYETASQVIQDLVRLEQGEPVEPLLSEEKTLELRRSSQSQPGGKGEPTAPGRALGLSGGPGGAPGTQSFLGKPPPENAPIPRWIIGAFLFLSLTLVSMMIDFGGDYLPQSVVVQPGLNGFRVSWKTGDAIPSVVQVRGGKEAEWRSFFPDQEAEGGVRDHSVDVGGFQQGDRLEFRLAGPEGTPSPSREVELLEFRIRELRLEARNKGVFRQGGLTKKQLKKPWGSQPVPVVLSFQTTIQVETFFLSGGPGEDQEIPAESEGGLRHRLVLDLPPARWEDPRLVATTEVGDLIELSLVEALSQRAEKLAGQFSEVDVLGASRGVPPENVSTPEEREEYFLRTTRETPGFESMYELYLLAPWILKADEVPTRARVRTYEALDQAFQMIWFAHSQDVYYLAREYPRDWGLFQETNRSRFSGKVRSLPLDLGEKDTFGTVLGNRSQEATLVLDAPPKKGQAELEIRTEKDMDNEMGLMVTINGEATLSFYGTRNNLETGEQFFHGFPADLLRKGQNTFRVEILNQINNVSAATIQVKAVNLRFPETGSR